VQHHPPEHDRSFLPNGPWFPDRVTQPADPARRRVIVAVQAMNHAIATYWQVAAAQT
jgi:hypothetical protein